jgi:hypothetical protein
MIAEGRDATKTHPPATGKPQTGRRPARCAKPAPHRVLRRNGKSPAWLPRAHACSPRRLWPLRPMYECASQFAIALLPLDRQYPVSVSMFRSRSRPTVAGVCPHRTRCGCDRRPEYNRRGGWRGHPGETSLSSAASWHVRPMTRPTGTNRRAVPRLSRPESGGPYPRHATTLAGPCHSQRRVDDMRRDDRVPWAAAAVLRADSDRTHGGSACESGSPLGD